LLQALLFALELLKHLGLVGLGRAITISIGPLTLPLAAD
jgi:hypothetical protein